MIIKLIGRAALTAVAVCSLVLPVLAQEEADEEAVEGTKKCIPVYKISSIDVLDNQHIRFEVLGGPDYMNTLPNKCPGLTKYSPIMYKTALSQLCDLDTITVLHEVGSGFMRGASCGLGKFVPMDEHED